MSLSILSLSNASSELKDTFDDLLHNDKSIIIADYYNSNVLRLTNGLQITWGGDGIDITENDGTLTRISNNDNCRYKYYTTTFAKPFIDQNYVVMFNYVDKMIGVAPILLSAVETSSMQITLCWSQKQIAKLWFHYIALGRWK